MHGGKECLPDPVSALKFGEQDDLSLHSVLALWVVSSSLDYSKMFMPVELQTGSQDSWVLFYRGKCRLKHSEQPSEFRHLFH